MSCHRFLGGEKGHSDGQVGDDESSEVLVYRKSLEKITLIELPEYLL